MTANEQDSGVNVIHGYFPEGGDCIEKFTIIMLAHAVRPTVINLTVYAYMCTSWLIM